VHYTSQQACMTIYRVNYSKLRPLSSFFHYDQILCPCQQSYESF
jgi:hypothetical protein